MSDFKLENLKLDYAAIGLLLKSDAAMGLCVEEAKKRVKDGQHIKAFVGFDRCHALIYQNTSQNPG